MKLHISPGAAVAAALIYFWGDWPEIAALAVPVAVHELGHITLMKAVGYDIRSLNAEICGLCISYSGSTGTFGDILAAAAGPTAGIMYALAASWAASRFDSRWLSLSAGISWVLSVFNLLPIMPLDGWRILKPVLISIQGYSTGERITETVSSAGAVLFFVYGLWLLSCRHVIEVCAAGLWLLLYQLNDNVRA